MPLLVKKKLPLGIALIVVGLLLSVISGLHALVIGTALLQVFTVPSTIKMMIVIVVVGILGSILKAYGFLDRLVDALQILIPNRKTLIMTVPAVMGLMGVPGGTFLSAPFTEIFGKDLDLPVSKRAAINMSFWHMSMFILPFTTTMLFVTNVISTVAPQIKLYSLMGLNVVFGVIFQVIAYFVYVKGAKKTVKATAGASKGNALIQTLIYLSPIYMALIFNAVYKIEIYQAIFLCLCWLLFICDNQKRGMLFCFGMLGVLTALRLTVRDPAVFTYAIYAVIALCFITGLLMCKSRKEYLKAGVKGFNALTLVMLIGVFFLQNIIKNLDKVLELFSNLFVASSGFGMLLVVAAMSLLFGLTTGLNLVPMGVIMPLVAVLPIGVGMKLVYMNFVFMWSFLGYYYSPLHLCQIMTLKVIDCPVGKLYKEHLKAIPFAAVVSFLLHYLYRFLFA